MQTIVFTCETITPLFMSGADGLTPELRPPAIKGALRFWWRAMNGHLPLEALKTRESLIFGGTEGETGGRSKVIVRALPLGMTEETALLVPHKPHMKQNAFKAKSRFEVTLSLIPNPHFSFEQTKSLFELLCLLGGLGKRSRRGMGSVRVLKTKEGLNEESYQQPDLNGILKRLNTVNNKFISSNDTIYSDFRRVQNYATIKEIQIGRPQNNVLLKISDTTSKFHKNNFSNYSATFGHAMRGRFASPVYVSALQEGANLKAIVTILHTEPKEDKHLVKTDLQQQFKKEIL